MKQTYQTPELVFHSFECEDVLTASPLAVKDPFADDVFKD
jgi:hypothetical protein